MSIKLDLEAAKKAVAERIASRQPPARERALSTLRDAVDADLSVFDFVSYVLAACERFPFVSESVAAIKVGEVLGNVGAAKSSTSKRGKGQRSEGVEMAVKAVSAYLSSAKEPVSKQQVADALPSIPAGTFGTAFAAIRSNLVASGKGPSTLYKWKKA
jgi:hypothetical protein